MAARAIYKARLRVGSLDVPVKWYSAVEDRSIHFRLLHEADGQPVVQQLMDKTTEKPIERDAVQKAYPLKDGRLVKLSSTDLQSLEAPSSREVTLSHFIPAGSVEYSLYERPYYLGPDGNPESYFALGRALAQRKREGIAHFAMRKRRYVGLLREQEGYLMMITLRHVDEVLDVGAFAPSSKELTKQEQNLAQQLIEALKGPFEPESYQDEYRERVRELIAQKAKGQVIPLRPPKKVAAVEPLTDALKSSLQSLTRKRA